MLKLTLPIVMNWWHWLFQVHNKFIIRSRQYFIYTYVQRATIFSGNLNQLCLDMCMLYWPFDKLLLMCQVWLISIDLHVLWSCFKHVWHFWKTSLIICYEENVGFLLDLILFIMLRKNPDDWVVCETRLHHTAPNASFVWLFNDYSLQHRI